MSIEIRDQRKPGWFWADRDIILKDGECLGPYSIAIYAALCCYADTEHKAFPSVSTLAEKVGCSERKARECLTDLERTGWVKSESNYRPDGSQTSNTYHLLASPHSGATQGYPSAGGGYSGADKREPVKDIQLSETAQRLWEKHFGLTLSKTMEDKFTLLLEQYGVAETEIVMIQAVERNARNIAYLRATLEGRAADGKNGNKPAPVQKRRIVE